MKKIALVLMAIALISASALAGDMAKQGQWGIQTSLGIASQPVTLAGQLPVASVGAKFMVSENIAVRVELGFVSSSPSGGGGSTSGYNIGAGFEYHMESKGGNVSPYVGAQLGFAGMSVPGGGTTPTSFSVGGVFGGEYFFSSNFSWGGELGIGFNSQGVSGATTTTIATGSATMIATWYLN